VMALWNTYRARKVEREHPPRGRFVAVDGVRLAAPPMKRWYSPALSKGKTSTCLISALQIDLHSTFSNFCKERRSGERIKDIDGKAST
jgi:hypothetical protein